MINEYKLRDDFDKWCPYPIGDIANALAWQAYKACAESYENKLAENDVEIESEKLHASMQFDLINSLKQQLSEANARNARLEVAANTAIYCYDKRPENFAYALEELKSATEENRAANSEAVAAWEAEKQATAEAYERKVQVDTLRDLMMNWNYAIGIEDNITRRIEEFRTGII